MKLEDADATQDTSYLLAVTSTLQAPKLSWSNVDGGRDGGRLLVAYVQK